MTELVASLESLALLLEASEKKSHKKRDVLAAALLLGNRGKNDTAGLGGAGKSAAGNGAAGGAAGKGAARGIASPAGSALKRKLLTAAYLGFDKYGKPINPVSIMVGDELRLQDPHQPAAGMLSRSPAGRPFAIALEALAAGLTAEIQTELYEKHWIVDGDPCEECDENGLAGWLAMDESYPWEGEPGDIHPNCRCVEIVRRMQ